KRGRRRRREEQEGQCRDKPFGRRHSEGSIAKDRPCSAPRAVSESRCFFSFLRNKAFFRATFSQAPGRFSRDARYFFVGCVGLGCGPCRDQSSECTESRRQR